MRTGRSAFVVTVMVTAGFLAVVGLACGQQTCGASCAGCCSSSGACVAGTDSTACGTSGAACVACSGACTNGVCAQATGGGSAGGSAAGGSADAGACPGCTGCCDNGSCKVGVASNACGTGGAACSNCLTQNKECFSKRCEVRCSSATCPNGCCTADNQCFVTTTTAACGMGGERCVKCQAGETCEAGLCTPTDGGTGMDGGMGCSQTCAIGCCDIAGVCQPGTQPSACGTLGGPCETCGLCQPNMTTGGGRCR